AMLSNYSSEDRHFDDGRLSRLLRSKLTRERSLATIATMVERKRLGGVVVDFENIPDDLVPDLVRFLKELHAVLAPMGATLGQAVGADDDLAAIRCYAAIDDRVYLMLYDEHYGTSNPGPVASQQWYLARTRRLLGVVPPEKAILAVGAYGYDWNDGDGRTGSEMTFQDVMAVARDHHAALRFDRESLNPYMKWTEPDSTDHVVWYLDGVSAYDQMTATSSLGVAGHAVWRLGSEDPSLWRVLGRTGIDQPASALASIPFAGYDDEFKGTGEILRLDSAPDTGVRAVTMDSASRYVVAESVTTVPAPWVIRRTGESAHRVALTFDDGPDGRWTPAVLDTLRYYHAPATTLTPTIGARRTRRRLCTMSSRSARVGMSCFCTTAAACGARPSRR
ncbi:MAG: polysaccharide deacetylase family protein, partial [Gemmatimonadaceae bacterium]